jgi:hypothetical protein
MWKTWANIYQLRLDSIPVCGMTWYSLIDQIDWDTALREKNDRMNPLGLCDLDRKYPSGRARLSASDRTVEPSAADAARPADFDGLACRDTKRGASWRRLSLQRKRGEPLLLHTG